MLLFTLVASILLYYFIINFKKIKEYVKWRIRLSKLPTVEGWKFFIGHAGYFVGVSKENYFKMLRDNVNRLPAVHTFYLGPVVASVGISGADEMEAIISSMKNLPKAHGYEFLHDWLEDGLLTSEGQQWQTRRKILTPAFHFSILREFVEIFNQETYQMVKQIEENHLKKPVNVLPLISQFTLLTINETSMGTKLDTNIKEGLLYKESVYLMSDLIHFSFLKPWYHIKFIFENSSVGKNAKKLVNILHNFTDNIIQQRSENFKIFEEPNNEDEEFYLNKRKYPLLDVLLNAKFKDNSIDEKGIREEVNTFMFEGHDTTAMSLTFTCMLLACNKKEQDEIYKEIIQILGTDPVKEPTYADLQNMTFLERCIKESLRLYPSVPVIGRKLTTDVATQFGVIPKGTTCYLHIYDLHRNPKHWTNPDKFDPSRHLPENSRGRHSFAYIPFSAGPRNCIGQRFAMLELKAAICGLIRKFVLEPIDTPETVVLTQDLVLRPSDGVKVKFLLRNNY